MQVFLPYPDFEKSLRCLDPQRLGNQVYREAKTLVGGGWKNHPVSKMWAGYEYALCDYALAGLKVLAEHKRYYPHWVSWFQEKQKLFPNTGLPPFIGNKSFHASHRSNLLFKGRVDRLWVTGYPKSVGLTKKQLKELINHGNIAQYEHEAKLKGFKFGKNNYEQFGWEEPDDLPYMWPIR